jgi:hypothetical protein
MDTTTKLRGNISPQLDTDDNEGSDGFFFWRPLPPPPIIPFPPLLSLQVYRIFFPCLRSCADKTKTDPHRRQMSLYFSSYKHNTFPEEAFAFTGQQNR